jgi:protocatechuate 3,4-dioxygenase beta subunit
MTQIHFDGDFRSDMQMFLSRRTLLLGGTGLVLAGCNVWPFTQAEANVTGQTADGSACIKLPGEMVGPFPADGTNRIAGSTVNVLDKIGVIREDIRTSFDGLTDIAEGVPLLLTLKLVNVSNACLPLRDHVIYIWQCDAGGQYSLYERKTANYLRGAVVTDADGVAKITTVFPGCYPGRWPHLHVQIFASKETAINGSASLLTSQFAFNKKDCDAAYASNTAYAASPANLAKLSLERDMIFANNTPEQLAAQTLAVVNGAASATIGIVGA